MDKINTIKYFETEVTFSKGYNLLVDYSEKKNKHDSSLRITVYCKAVPEGEVYTVTLVNADTSQPFIMLMKNVAQSFLTGTKEVQQSLFNNKHEFVTNLTK